MVRRMDEIKNNILWSKGSTGLKLMTKNYSSSSEFREWNPYKSELAAALINGIEIFPIEKNSKVLYFDDNTESTLNHILDIIDLDGKIILISDEKSQKIHESKYQKIPNIEIKFFSNDLNCEQSDILYINSPEKNSLNLLQKLQSKLKKNGYFILVLHTVEMNQDTSSDNINTYEKIKSLFDIIQVVFLDSYFKNQTMIIGRKISEIN